MLNNFNELDRRRFITNLTLTTLGVSVIPSFAESLDINNNNGKKLIFSSVGNFSSPILPDI